MNKKLLFISASVVTGIVGSLLFKKNKQQSMKEHQQLFIGNWHYLRRNNECVQVTITSDFKLLIQGKEQNIRDYQLTSTRLSFLDQMGYEIMLEQQADAFYFYDETEDSSYKLTKQLSH
ncbi:DUF4828 domain-containing protein [Enterococcus sp.]|uniref:DUF4828 domain-containing protein n=1 Tax=Enterococcus sp. TaxID=35783 RepID=UPI002FCBFD30